MDAASILPNCALPRQTPRFRPVPGRDKLLRRNRTRGETLGRLAMWNLRQFVERYLTLADGFGKPVALSQFGLSAGETVAVFSSFDEDYHISRYLHFSNRQANSYLIGGEQITHLSIDASIQEIL